MRRRVSPCAGKGFWSDGCGTWTSDLSAITTDQTGFGDGVWIVGTDLVTGTYRSSGGPYGSWKRLGFGWRGRIRAFNPLIQNPRLALR